jgi:SAM-dependent methyltransferase
MGLHLPQRQVTVSSHPVQIDADGFLVSAGIKLNDNDFGYEVLQNISIFGRTYSSSIREQKFTILPFDNPLIARQVQILNAQECELIMPYGYRETVKLKNFVTDEWDRFHNFKENGVPIVLSSAAQGELFRTLESFDDDSITMQNNRYEIKNYLPNAHNVESKDFWSARYQTWQESNEKPGWDLSGPHPALPEILQQIKLPKSRIAVLGAGAGHDAHYLASQGHLVTAFDISLEAINKARSLYPESKNLKFVEADALNLPAQYTGQFDLIFEHTFFCAINPSLRARAVKSYKSLLTPGGFLLGLFFTITLGDKPPFGTSEWELRQRLSSHFELLYWTRPQKNPPGREHWELIVFAKRL